MSMEAEAEKMRQRADQLDRLRTEFPDLREYRTRWRTVLVSKGVNAKPEGVYTNHTCGCCNDAVYQAWFFAERNGEKVYSDPPTVSIGEKIPYRDYDEPEDKLWEGWEESVRKVAGDAGVALLQSTRESL